MHVDDPARALDRLRLALAQPEQLVERRRRVGRLAGEPVHLVGAQVLDLAGGPYVHPDDGGTHRAAVLVEARERLALVRDGDRLDARGSHRLDRPANGEGGGSPPVLCVLLVPARPRQR